MRGAGHTPVNDKPFRLQGSKKHWRHSTFNSPCGAASAPTRLTWSFPCDSAHPDLRPLMEAPWLCLSLSLRRRAAGIQPSWTPSSLSQSSITARKRRFTSANINSQVLKAVMTKMMPLYKKINKRQTNKWTKLQKTKLCPLLYSRSTNQRAAGWSPGGDGASNFPELSTQNKHLWQKFKNNWDKILWKWNNL